MNLCGISDSVASVVHGPEPCPSCGSTSQVGRGLCLQCLLQTAFEPAENRDSDPSTSLRSSLAQLLDEIDVRDADWRLGNYQILEEIGRGGMGVIYRARQRHSRRIVALKRVLSYHADSRDTLVRFRREAEAAASLDHPNILPIYEVSESEDGLPYFSMKFAPGGSLFEAAPTLREEPRRAVALMAKVSRAVQYAHVQGILHRDLKPGNVLLDARGEPLVSDFGLAKWLDTTSDLTRTLTIFGTPGYIAPEQARGPAAHLTPAADVYSLGAILFDLFTGRPPFLGEHALAVIQQASEKPAPKLRALVSHLDRDLETICAKCLERDPRARYRSAGELAQDLERYLEGRPIIARPVLPPTRVWRWSKRNPNVAGSVAACLVIGALAAGFQIRNRASERAVALAMHSIAVEPFLDLDSAQYDAAIGGEVATALQHELSKRGPAQVTTLTAKSTTTVADSAERAADRWNGARTAVQGTKRIRDGKLRVSLRLLNTADSKTLYKKIVEADSAERGASVIAQSTASELYRLLDQRDLPTAELIETDPAWRNATTRELLLAGRAVQERRTLVDMARAVELFEQAVKIEPASPLAHSYLAEAEFGRSFFTGDPKYLSAASVAAKDAVRVGPRVAEAHKATAEVLLQQARFRESLEEAFTAYELVETDDGRLPTAVAANLRMLGEPGRAVAWYMLSKDGRPGANDLWGIADCFADLSEDDKAATEYRRIAMLFPELPEGWMGLCRLALLQKNFAVARKIASENWQRYRDFIFSEQMAAQVEFFGRSFSEAEKLYAELAARDPNGGGTFYGCVSYQSALGRLRLAAGDQANGTRILKQALAKEQESLRSAARHPSILYRIAAIEASLGKVDSAFDHLRAAAEAGFVDYRSAVIDPRFDSMATHAEFKTILQSIQSKLLKSATTADAYR